MSETSDVPTHSPRRSAFIGVLPAILGAVLASAACVGVAVAFIAWRDSAQRELLAQRKALCERDDRTACDLLRSACLKRSAEGCLALADTYLGTGPRRDPTEGARLLTEACEHNLIDACRRAAVLYAEGRDVPADPGRAAELRRRACAVGDKTSCSSPPSPP